MSRARTPRRLARPLTLEMAEKVADGAGGFVEVWTPLGLLWAEVRHGSGRETAGQALPLSRTAFQIVVRGAPQGALSRPVAGQRFIEGARRFAIKAVTEESDRGDYLICFCNEERAT